MNREIPALPIQRQFWLLQKMAPEIALTNISTLLDWEGPLDLAALQMATFDFVSRHSYMRTKLMPDSAGQLVQRLLPAQACDIEVKDLSHLSIETRTAVAEEIVSKLAEQPLATNFVLPMKCLVVRVHANKYKIAFVFSHLNCDGLSTGILCRDFLKAYESRLTNKIPTWVHPVPECPHLDMLNGVGEPTEGKEIDERIQLPYQSSANGGVGYRGKREQFSFDVQSSELINSVSKNCNVSPFVTWLSLIQIVIHQYCSQREFKFDVVTSGRTGSDKRSVGPFFQTVPLDLDLRPDVSLTELLENNSRRIQNLGRQKFQGAVLSDNRSQVLVDYQTLLQPVTLSNGVSVSPREVDNGAALAELCFGIRKNKRSYSGHVKFDSELFDRRVILLMIERLATSLDSLLKMPDRPINEHQCVLNSETELIRRFNRVASKSETRADSQSVHQQFERQVNDQPDSLAISTPDESLSYNEFDQLINRIATGLTKHGVKHKDTIGCCFCRGINYIASIWAAIRLGVTFVPIDPEAPSMRAQEIVDEMGLEYVVSDRECPLNVKQSICVNELLSFNSEDSAAKILPRFTDLQDIAYVMFTSGSTGRPKGVAVSHGNLLNFFVGVDRLNNGKVGTWLSLTKPTFDISIFELVWTLCRGFHVVVDEPRTSIVDSFNWLAKKWPVTHFQSTPSLMTLLIRDPVSRQKLTEMERIFVGGEKLGRQLASEMCELTDVDCFNMYGPTETTIWSTAWKIEPDQDVRIGIPLANQTAWVVNQSGAQVPVGVVGELVIGGKGVSKGYVNDRDLSELRFRPGPDDQHSYFTGDQVRILPDGELDFVGRIDRQVKIAGHRVELGEIESVLNQHSRIQDSIVVLHGHNIFGAYVADAEIAMQELMSWVSDHLPRQMVPSKLVPIERIPLNGSGKVDHRKVAEFVCEFDQLKTMDGNRIEVDTNGDWTVQQRNQLMDLVGTKLGRSDLSPNFLWQDLEMDSLEIVGLVAKIENEFDVQVPVSDLFGSGKISETLNKMFGIEKRDASSFSDHESEIEEGVI